MSSSSKKSASATKKTVASKAVECPKSMKTEDGTLSYSLQEKAAAEWVVLSCVGPEQTVNVGPISFDQGSVSITQKVGGNRCILRLDKGKYTLKPCVVVSKDLGGPALVATFEPHTPPTCQFESNHGDEGKAVASGFPLAIQSGKMHRLQLRLSSQGLDWKVVGAAVTKNANALKSQLMQLCAGHSSAETRKQRLLEDADREERETAVVGVKAREKLAEYQTLQDEADAHSRRAASLRQEAAGTPVDEEAMAMRMQGMGISDNL
ncbi:MAG: hypothetical protein Q9208_008027 [Pyrenodesmia sp. 3 TL-2023]